MEELTRDYLTAVDEALPGYVQGLYVVGSYAIGAWQPGASDLDTVILTSRPATGDDLAELAKIHAAMPESPHFDGVYLEPELARSWPTHQETVPFVVDGQFQTGKPCGELNPAVWLLLQRYGVRVRGPAVGELGIPLDPDELRRYNLGNLRDFWQAHATQFPAALADVPPDTTMDAYTVTFFVLGPARLHYTLTHGDIVSKTAAGSYLTELFPQYADLAERAVRWRAGKAEEFTARDLKAAGESTIAVAEDAWRRYGS